MKLRKIITKTSILAMAIVCAAGQLGASAVNAEPAASTVPHTCKLCTTIQQTIDHAEELTWEIGTIVEIEDQLIPISDGAPH